MLDETAICRLIKETDFMGVKVLQMQGGTHTGAFAFAINGHVVIRATECERKIVSRLIGVGAMGTDYGFRRTTSISGSHGGGVPDNSALISHVGVTYMHGKERKTICVMQGEQDICFVQAKYIDCFSGVSYMMTGAEGAVHVMDSGDEAGIVMPFKSRVEPILPGLLGRMAPNTAISPCQDDVGFGHCINCGRKEQLKAWKGYGFCPKCGMKHRNKRGARMDLGGIAGKCGSGVGQGMSVSGQGRGRMTAKELNQLHRVKQEIGVLQAQLCEIRAQSRVGGQVMNGMPFAGGTSDRTAAMAVTVHQIEARLEAKVAELIRVRVLAEQFIDSIDDPETRLVIRLRCINDMSWEGIGKELGMDRRTASRKFYSFLEVAHNARRYEL